MSPSRPRSFADPHDFCPARFSRAACISPAVFCANIPVGPTMITTIFSLCANYPTDAGRPAMLSSVFFANMHRDSLKSIAFLFQLPFGAAALPLFETPFPIANTSTFSPFSPGSHLASSFSSSFSPAPAHTPATLDLVKRFAPGRTLGGTF